MIKDLLSQLIHSTDVHPGERRFLLVSQSVTWLAMGMHAAFFAVFAWLDITVLAWFNLGSVLLYSICLVFNRRGRSHITYTVGTLEVLAHAALAVRVLGWDSGFHYYIICLTPLIFFFPLGRTFFKASLAGLLCGIYFSLFMLMHNLEPLNPLPQEYLDIIGFTNITATFVVFSFLAHFYLRSANEVEEEIKQANALLTELAHTDPLTHLLNRRTMMECLEEQASRFQTENQPFSILLCDVDNFKTFNDRYGHECGDYVLTAVSQLMQTKLRKQDSLARWGGEEFLVLLPGTNLGAAWEVADLLREYVYHHVFLYEGLQLCITLTFGVAVYNNPGENVTRCISRADNALYEGKQRGKNCVVLATRHTGALAALQVP